MATSENLTLSLSRETIRKIVSKVEDHDLYRAIIRAQDGESIDAILIEEWSDHWPVIDTDLRLTGEVVTSDCNWWSNYSDLAAVNTDDAIRDGWIVQNGYASPPDDEDDDAED